MTTVECSTPSTSLAIAHPLQHAGAAAPAQPAIQTGPSYHCFLCGAPAAGLRYWPVAAAGFSKLDAYAGSIGYLRTTCQCHVLNIGCTRVAMLEGSITPLHLATAAEMPSWDERTDYNVALVRATLVFLEDAAKPIDPTGLLPEGEPGAPHARIIHLIDTLESANEWAHCLQAQLQAERASYKAQIAALQAELDQAQANCVTDADATAYAAFSAAQSVTTEEFLARR